MTSKRELTVEGVILRIIKFKESSVIVKILTPKLGLIDASIRGFRKKNSPYIGIISNLNYITFELYKSPDNELYIVKSASLISPLSATNNYDIMIYQSAGAEIMMKLPIHEEKDTPKTFHLLVKYLDYLRGCKSNAIAIFWRFLLRYYSYLGTPLKTTLCCDCGVQLRDNFFYSIDDNSLVCSNCKFENNHSIKLISTEATAILLQLPYIGNVLTELEINNALKREITQLLLFHISHSLHKDVYLKSISDIYSPNIPKQ